MHRVTFLARVLRIVDPRAECLELMLDVMGWVRMSPSWEATKESRGVQEPRKTRPEGRRPVSKGETREAEEPWRGPRFADAGGAGGSAQRE